jgi:hypothetical protein
LWEVPTKSEKVGPNDPQKPTKWVTKRVSGQSALITAIIWHTSRTYNPEGHEATLSSGLSPWAAY